MTAKYAGPTVNEQLRTLARDAAYDDKPFDLIAAATEIGRALSGVERRMAQVYYQTCRAELAADRESIMREIDEIREDDRHFRESCYDPDEIEFDRFEGAL